jgi:hypothetical protein
MGLEEYRVDAFSSDYDDTQVDESGYGIMMAPLSSVRKSFGT